MRGFRRGARRAQFAVNVPRGLPIRLLRFCEPRLRMAAHRFAITFNPAVKLVISSSVLRSMAALANLAQFVPHRLKP